MFALINVLGRLVLVSGLVMGPLPVLKLGQSTLGPTFVVLDRSIADFTGKNIDACFVPKEGKGFQLAHPSWSRLDERS